MKRLWIEYTVRLYWEIHGPYHFTWPIRWPGCVLPGRLSHCDRFADSAKPPIVPVAEVKTQVANIHRVKENSYKLQKKNMPIKLKQYITSQVSHPFFINHSMLKAQVYKGNDMERILHGISVSTVSITWRDRRACTTPRWPPAAARWRASIRFVCYFDQKTRKIREPNLSTLAVFPPLSGTSTLQSCSILC